MRNLAEQIFEGQLAKEQLETQLEELGIEGEIGFDFYDCSIEFYHKDREFRLPPSAQELLHKSGFRIAFVNHQDGWETHYQFKEIFCEQPGWRVSYPHVRNNGDPAILLEKPCDNWPADWFASGKVKLI